ncbi:MAG: two-component system response regulator CreB [Verrucomicrobiales bacterium]|nr:two-component system response regulator CreB [Verrucomicrobiales bacterium]
MSKLSVLIVEDEPTIAETLIYSLETEGFAVTHVETGSGAIDHFRNSKPDFLVLDVGLPDMTGFEVCREIRKISEIPLLFLTARESEIDRVVGLELGADDYVAKPFSPRELTARIHAILRRTWRNPPHTEKVDGCGSDITLGRITLIPDRYEAQCDGEDLQLSRYEFGMLRVFMEHPGRVYTRDQLMDLVWDEPEAALDRTVDAHIKTLRKKLHRIDQEFDPVKTHRGIGYSFSPPGSA